MVGFIRRHNPFCAIWGGRVELRILGECLLAFLPVAVNVFPDLRSAVDKRIRTNTDHVSVLVVKRFGLGVLLAAYFPDYQRDGRDGSELWSGIVPQWVEVDGVKGIAGVVDEELFS